MAIERHGGVVRSFRTLMHLGAVGTLTDGQLLERFLAGGAAAEMAFAALVERHGPMVLRVCRSVLGDPHAAHDAFQATFLVLVQRARSLWVRDSLGPWLHRVAVRVASCARSADARRRRHERRAAELSVKSEVPVPDGDRGELGAILHEELARLPERYRVPLVLCDLQGQPHELAARHLGCAVGTVKSRLSRGREKLRARLTRRGLAPAVGLAGLGIGPGAAQATVPTALIHSTTVSTTAFAATRAAGGSVPASVVGLAEGALQAMILAKVRMSVISALAVAAALGAGVLAQGNGNGQVPERTPPETKTPRPETSQVEPKHVDGLPVHEVTTGPLRVMVVERGSLESSSSTDVISEVEGQTTILSILPEGTKVQKGDFVCELDSSGLRDRLINQEIATKQAEANLEQARTSLDIAEIAVREYLEGLYPLEEQTGEGRIALAKSELAPKQA